MAIETEEPQAVVEEEEQEGGPVKSFLEHLEDLRWTLIKSITAASVAMLLCLLAGNYVVGVIERPLQKAKMKYPRDVQVWMVFFGTNQLGIFQIHTNQVQTSPFGTNPIVAVQVEPVLNGSEVQLRLKVDTNAPVAGATRLPIQIINLSPAGAFVVAVRVAFYGGLVLASPFILYFIAQFVFPALKMKEKKYVYRGLLFGGGLFAAGITFCYFLLMPVALAASVQYSEWLGFSATTWRAEDFITFVCKFMLGMGLGFELPVVVLVLVKIGILNYQMLAKARRYVIIINFVLGAMLTTPEIITQILMAVPLQILYEISVWIAWYWERKEKKRAAGFSDN